MRKNRRVFGLKSFRFWSRRETPLLPETGMKRESIEWGLPQIDGKTEAEHFQESLRLWLANGDNQLRKALNLSKIANSNKICGAKAGLCVCHLMTHDCTFPHTCFSDECGGQWHSDPFKIVTLPFIGQNEDDLMSRVWYQLERETD
jgi:hypothetical protein